MPKTYRVIGTAPIFDHQPGEKFTADLSDVEGYLVSIGGLEIVEGEKPEPTPLPTPPVADLPEPAPIKNPEVPHAAVPSADRK